MIENTVKSYKYGIYSFTHGKPIDTNTILKNSIQLLLSHVVCNNKISTFTAYLTDLKHDFSTPSPNLAISWRKFS